MNKYLKAILTTLAIVLAINADAQLSYRFYNISQANGLNSNVITEVAEDGDGFIWIGTQTGLIRFDGQMLVPFNNINDSLNLEGSNIADLKADQNGDIWIATDLGMSKYSILSEKTTHYPINNNGTIISRYRADKIFINNDNDIIFFTSDGYLCKFNREGGYFEKYLNDFFAHRHIKFCFEDIDKTYWAVHSNASTIYHITSNGAIIDSLECVSKYPYPLLVTNTLINNGDGTLWMGSYAGIYQINPQAHTITLIEDLDGKPLPHSIKSFYKRSNGDIWIGTNGEELYVVNRNRKTVNIIESDRSQQSVRQLNSLTVNSMFEDSNGIMWFGTWHGLSFMNTQNPNRFEAISYPENSGILTQNQISAICAAPNGTLAIGTDGGGIVFWNGKSTTRDDLYNHFIQGSRMNNSSILAAAYDKEGNLWSGGYNNPLHKLSPDHKTSEIFSLVNNVKDVKSDFIVDIIFDKQDRMWVLTNGAGLLNFDPKTKKFTRVDRDSRLVEPCSIYGTCLANGPQNSILVGTYSGMYVYYPDKDIIENYSYSDGIPYTISHNVVNDITLDSHERIWVATPAGINKFDINRGVFTRLKEDDLKKMNCTNVIEDKKHDIWFTTNRGIIKYNPEVNMITRIYGADDGVLSNNFEKNTSYVSDDGCVYIGTHDGVILFYPVNVKTAIKVPKPVLTNLLISYNKVLPNTENSPLTQAIANTDEISLDWSDITFSFEFTSLDYIFGKSTNFFYKLDGYDKKWINIGTRREVGFTNLNPGTYKFRLIAENSDRIRSEERTLIIHIRPPWYKTKLAIAVFIILTLLTIWLIHRLRIRRLRNRQHELENIVKDRTSKLTKLNAVLESRNEEMKQQNEEIQSQRDELFDKNNELHASREALQKSYQSLLDLSELDKQISESSDINTIVEKVYHNKVVPLDQCGFCICKRTKKMDIIEFSPYIENNEKTILNDEKVNELSDFLTATCFDECTEIIADNTSVYEIPSKLVQQGYRTCLRIPLFSNGIVGAVMIINSRIENAFSKSDIAIFKVIASYSEIVIEKADAYSMLKSRNLAISGSISYAKTIQQILLPQISDFKKYFDADVIYRPRDIVSGDYIWLSVIKNNGKDMIFASVIDCTGHGVPGAFMSLISNQMIRHIVKTKKVYEPAQILTRLSAKISTILKQENGENKDGMDMSLCRFDLDNEGHITKMVYAGAKNTILICKSGSNMCEMIPADRISIAGGIRSAAIEQKFTQKEFEINPGDQIYMYTDGIIDQNNIARSRFGRRRLIETVNSNARLDLSEQIKKLEQQLDDFAQDSDQRDDITFLALRIREKTIIEPED